MIQSIVSAPRKSRDVGLIASKYFLNAYTRMNAGVLIGKVHMLVRPLEVQLY